MTAALSLMRVSERCLIALVVKSEVDEEDEGLEDSEGPSGDDSGSELDARERALSDCPSPIGS